MADEGGVESGPAGFSRQVFHLAAMGGQCRLFAVAEGFYGDGFRAGARQKRQRPPCELGRLFPAPFPEARPSGFARPVGIPHYERP